MRYCGGYITCEKNKKIVTILFGNAKSEFSKKSLVYQTQSANARKAGFSCKPHNCAKGEHLSMSKENFKEIKSIGFCVVE